MAGKDSVRRDAAYRAVGRYVVEFSRLIAYMRFDLERYMAVEEDRMAPALALGAAPARQIADAFFAVSEYVGELNDEELRVARRLRAETHEEIERRNDFAHGDWLVEGMVTDPEHPVLRRVKPSRKKGPIERRELPVGELDSASEEVYVLRQKVAEFGAVCLDQHPFQLGGDDRWKVRHVLALDGNGVEIISPVPVEWP